MESRPTESPAPAQLGSPRGSSAATPVAEQELSASSPALPSNHAAEASEPSGSVPDGPSKARPVAPSDAHVVVIQPDNEVNVGVDMAKWEAYLEELRKHPPAPEQSAASNAQASQGGNVDEASRVSLVLALQGSEHNSFLRRRALWFWLQALQMILYVVIIVLCVATPHNFAGSSSDLGAWNSNARKQAWLRDFLFAFGRSEAECVADAVVIFAVSFLGIAAAWTYSVQLMTCWVMLAVVITILGASTTLTPVIMLRLIFIILGFQVRAGVQRWHGAHVGNKPTLCGLFVASVAGVVSCCLCRPFCRRAGSYPPEADVERGTTGQPMVILAAPSAPQMARLSVTSQQSAGSGGPSIERRSAGPFARSSVRQALFRRDSPSPEAVPAVSLQLGDQVRTGGLQRELIWNRRAGLEPNSDILRNASTARVTVDAQGRRSVSMVGLAIPAGTATGDLNFR